MTQFFRIFLAATHVVALLITRTTFAQDIYPASQLSDIAVFPRLSAPAIVISLQETDISAQITANVDAVLADVGSEVKKGDVLLTLECLDYNLGVDMALAQQLSAAANLQLMENRHSRATRLLKKKLTSQEDVDGAKANLAAAKGERNRTKAALEIARLDQSRCEITAPFDGYISARYASKGQLATDRSPLFKIINHANLEVSAQLSEQHLKSLNEQTPFTFTGMKDYPLQLKRRVQALDSKTRTQEIRLGFKGERPLSGSAGKLAWNSIIPHLNKKYLAIEDGVTGYFTVDQGYARFVPLGKLIPERDYPVDIPLDTVIITGNLHSISDGDLVTIDIDEPLADSQSAQEE